jgi:hypothetical protein
VNRPRLSELKWLGIILVFTGLGVIPIVLLVFQVLHISVSEREFHLDLITLLVVANGSLIAGALILIIGGRSTQRRLK